MRKCIVLLFVVAMTFCMQSSALAAGAGIGAGSSEVGVQSSLMFTTTKPEGGGETKDTTTMFLANYGYFITDGLQVGGSLLTSGTSSEDIYGTETSSVTTGFDAFAKYHFYRKGQTVVPYVGAQLGVVGVSMDSGYGEATGSALSYGGMGGVKFFMSEKTSLNLELNYRHYDIDMDYDGYTSKSKTDSTALLIGFSVYF